MSRPEAINQYTYALKLGQRYYRSCVIRGSYPYPQVLDEIFSEEMCAGRAYIGLVDIPMDQIVGTTTAGRKSAFAGNFMPLLEMGTEFAEKWINLCTAHLDTVGIKDPIICSEYMGRFYVTEGNKRVSVLKSYGAATIPGIVTRLIPAYANSQEVQIYYEFMAFYQLSKIYDVAFALQGGYARLQAALGFAPAHVWTEDERRVFLQAYRPFRDAFDKANAEALPLAAGDALLAWLKVYAMADLERMTAAEVAKSLSAIWPDLRVLARGTPIAVSTDPTEEKEKPGLLQALGLGKPQRLSVAFVHTFDPRKSSWTAAHDLGRKHLEAVMGDRVSVSSYVCAPQNAVETMEEAVGKGTQVIFATTPPLMDACRQIAARHPGVKVMNCALSMPYTGVRTYYSRMYEAKFIIGAIAGAMAGGNRIGFVANYPIAGASASINAFALGARMVNPDVRVSLRWSCLPGDHVAELLAEGVNVISNRETAAGEGLNFAWEWGAYRIDGQGGLQPLASPCWNWGSFYEKVVRSIFSGGWEALSAKGADQAVNYWWGMNSGVIDVALSDALPAGVRQLADILKSGIVSGTFAPFHCAIRDQAGTVRNDGSAWFSPEEIMNMDWLCDHVDGEIPAFDQLLPASRQLVRLLGLYRDQLPPETEAAP